MEVDIVASDMTNFVNDMSSVDISVLCTFIMKRLAVRDLKQHHSEKMLLDAIRGIPNYCLSVLVYAKCPSQQL